MRANVVVPGVVAVAAGRHALERAGLRPSDLDRIIVATDTPDYLSPATAAVVQAKQGVKAEDPASIQGVIKARLAAQETRVRRESIAEQFAQVDDQVRASDVGLFGERIDLAAHLGDQQAVQPQPGHQPVVALKRDEVLQQLQQHAEGRRRRQCASSRDVVFHKLPIVQRAGVVNQSVVFSHLENSGKASSAEFTSLHSSLVGRAPPGRVVIVTAVNDVQFYQPPRVQIERQKCRLVA